MNTKTETLNNTKIVPPIAAEVVTTQPTNVELNMLPMPQEKELITDDKMLNILEETLNDIRDDRKELKEIASDFLNAVMNEGDATSSSKEAVVNLYKLISDTADKKTKIAELMTRIKLKDRDTFPKYLAQHNEVKISTGGNKRQILEMLKNKKKDNEQQQSS